MALTLPKTRISHSALLGGVGFSALLGGVGFSALLGGVGFSALLGGVGSKALLGGVVGLGARSAFREDFGEVAFGVQGGHAARAGRGHRLAVDGVGDVAGGEHALDAGRRGEAAGAAPDDDVAALHVELPLEDAGVRGVADRDEHALHGNLAQLVGLRVPDAHAGHALVVAEHLVEDVIPQHLDVAGL